MTYTKKQREAAFAKEYARNIYDICDKYSYAGNWCDECPFVILDEGGVRDCKVGHPYNWNRDFIESLQFKERATFRFIVGQSYHYPMLDGPTVTVNIDSRTDSKVTVSEYWLSEDTGEVVKGNSTDYEILVTEDSYEYFVAWEYHGHECHITAFDPNEN